MTSDILHFWFEGNEVGYFEDTLPRAAGRYRYMPYRGPGHSDMQSKLKNGEPAVCHFLVNGLKLRFTVNECPEYGVVSVTEIGHPESK